MSADTSRRVRPGAAPLPLFRRTMRSSWRSLIGWALGIAATVYLYLPLYPSLGGNGGMQDLIDQLPPALVHTIGYDTISTGAGYTQSTVFGLLGFVLFVIAATAWGTAAIAGDEEAGSLELTLAHGVSRTQLVLERAAAVLVRLVILGVLAVLLVLTVNTSAKLGLDASKLAATAAALTGLAFLSACAGIAAGAITGRRLFATAAGAGIAVLGYVLNALANNAPSLDWLHRWSPYSWAFHNSPLIHGADAGGLALLYGLSVVLVAIAVLAFNRRDIAG